MLTLLYRPPDADEAWTVWKASCGPAAVAALLGRPLAAVRDLFPGHAERGGWANPTHVTAALRLAGVRFRRCGETMPNNGLAFLQITGPWDAPGVPVGAAYRRTHWVAVRLIPDGTPSGESDDWVYDVNAGAEDGGRGDWWPLEHWRDGVMARVVASHPKATGWRVRVGYEVVRRAAGESA